MTFYTFANATSAIPLANLDANFATPITLGNTAVTINGTFSSIGNLTLNNANITSVAATFPNSFLANSTTTIGNTTVTLGSTSSSIGNLTLNNVTVASGNSTVTKETVTTITSPAATNLTIQSAGTTAMTIDTSQNVGIGTAPYGTGLFLYRNVAGLLYSDIQNPSTANSSDGSIQRVITSNVAGSGTTSLDIVKYKSGAASIKNNETNSAAYISFEIGSTERMRIDSSGNLLVGTTSQIQSGVFSVLSSASTAGLRTTAPAGSGIVVDVSRTSATGDMVYFRTSSTTLAGYITCPTGTTTSYVSVSDYRLKENVQPMTTGLAIICSLKPVTYDWISDNLQGEGFIAHELQEVIPLAVTGDKDAVNQDGSIKPQGVDYSKIVVHLVAALQELKAEFDAYKASHP